VGFEPTEPKGLNGFRDRPIRPLSHPSGVHPSPRPAAPTRATGGVYGGVCWPRMRRTNIYLSETEQAALDARAAVEGSTRSDVVRAIVDRELNLAEDAELDAALVRAADDIAARARRLGRADPDLRTV
jgi:hypothetical protein